MALDQNDKKWMQETFATKADLEPLATKEMFKAQSEFLSNAIRNQTQEILNSIASREKIEKLESQITEMDDRIEALEKAQKQTVSL